MARKIVTDEQKVARKLSDLFSDLRLDLEMVGVYLNEISPRVTVNRILLMAEILEDEKENRHYADF
jgi:hypothetical protein